METFDFIVVGAGAAGCVVASRLSEDRQVRVLLVEAGPEDRNPLLHIPAAFPRLYDGPLDWADRTTPQNALGGRCVFWPRGRVLGGSSSINAMMWIRGFAADYDDWASAAGPDWSYEAVLPYFRRIEDIEGADGVLHGSGGPLPVGPQRDPNPLSRAWLEAARSIGLAVSDGPEPGDQDGVALAWVNQRRGRRWSAVDAYLKPARRRPNLTVRTDAPCTRLLFDGRRANGVEVERDQALHSYAARRAVVVCTGAVASPALLMRSGIGSQAVLRQLGIPVVAASEEVGQNLQDHLAAGVALLTTSRRTLAVADRPLELVRYLVSRRGLLTSNVSEGYGYVRSNPNLATPDLELLFLPALFVQEGLVQDPRNGVSLAAVLLQPESRGSVTVGSPSATAPAIIDPGYLSDHDGKDAETLAVGIRRCLELVAAWPERSEIGPMVVPDPADGDIVETSLRRYSQTLYHPVGTCRMGTDASSVVDPQLQVRGVDGLRVVDASVMPRIPRGHTHASTLMIAEKAADLLRR